MACCSITLLGTMQFTLDGRPLQGLESAKVRLLLAYLAVESGQAHAREQLAGLFWPEMSESQARHSLSQAIHNLRQALGEAGTGDLSGQVGKASAFILVTPHTVQFNPHSNTCLDVHAFEQAIAAAHTHNHRRLATCPPCARLLQEAARLYQGDFLPGASLRGCQAFEEWALVQRERLHLLVCEALAGLVAYHEGRAEVSQGLAHARRWAAMDPFSEPAHQALMRLLALDGQRTQALAGYAAFARTLQAELGVEPARETQQLYQRILSEETAQATLPGMPGQLPVPLTPFVGRADELAELAAWLRDRQTRLVTLLGPGGSGKTRLALQVAYTLRYHFPDGIFLVSLSGTGSSEGFLPALASTLGITFQSGWGDPSAQLLGYLQNRRLLLILDSFEEVMDASTWVTRLLRGAASLQILATSRARLNLQPEQVFLLEGLTYPAPGSPEMDTITLGDYPALQLFHNTASLVRPDHPHSAEDMPHLARICQLVDGMPLGIMLAAAWMAVSSPAEIAAEVEHSLDFLASNWSDMPYRQRSLRATLDHSWQLLTSEERFAFQKLSIFQGAFSRQAAETVAQVGAVELRSLVDKSMLQASTGSYRMHDLLRQYGAEKLALDDLAAKQVRGAHSAFFLARLSGNEARLKSARRSETLREMDAEINDLQAAWKWASNLGEIARLASSLQGLCLYYEMRVRYPEGEQACQAGLSALPDNLAEAEILRARLLLWRASFLALSGELEAARSLRQQASALLDQLEAQNAEVRRPRAMYWQAKGEAQPDLKLKLECYQKGIALYQQLGDDWRQAGMLVWAGEYAMRLGDPGLALSLQQQALHLARANGEPGILLHCLRQSTYLFLMTAQDEKAGQLMQEAALVAESVAELPLRANAQMHLGMQLVHCGRIPEAIRALEQSVPVLRSLGYRYGMVYGTNALGYACVLNGEYERGKAILQAALLETEQGGFLREATVVIGSLGMIALALGQHDQACEHFHEMVGRYRRMQFAGELSMALGGLALAQIAAGQIEAAQLNLLEALPIAEKTHNMAALLLCLPALVHLFARRGQLQTALLVHRLTLLHPMLQASRWYSDILGEQMTAHWQALPPEQQAAIEAEAQPHNIFSIIPQVLALFK